MLVISLREAQAFSHHRLNISRPIFDYDSLEHDSHEIHHVLPVDSFLPQQNQVQAGQTQDGQHVFHIDYDDSIESRHSLEDHNRHRQFEIRNIEEFLKRNIPAEQQHDRDYSWEVVQVGDQLVHQLTVDQDDDVRHRTDGGISLDVSDEHSRELHSFESVKDNIFHHSSIEEELIRQFKSLGMAWDGKLVPSSSTATF